MPVISVIVCTRNRAHDLQETLGALSRISVPSEWAVELLIVDNASTDDTQQTVATARERDSRICYLHEPKVGQARARNTGLRAASGEVIVFTDDDVRPADSWLREVVEPILQGQCDVSVGKTVLAPHLRRPWMTGLHRSRLASTEDMGVNAPPGAATGANFAFARRVLDKVPTFDEELGPGRLGFWDDTLFSLQLKQAGFRFAFAPRALLEHHFDPRRLLRSSFLDRSAGEGRSVAYVAWHWDHAEYLRPALLLWRKRLKLWLLRFIRWRDCRRTEGCAEWEMSLCQQIGLFSQYRAERRLPRKYTQRGLIKIPTASGD